MGAVRPIDRQALRKLAADQEHIVAKLQQHHAGAVHAVVRTEVVGYGDEGAGHGVQMWWMRTNESDSS